MKTIGATEARANFADLLRRVASGGERIAIERRGKPLVALVPIAELEPADGEQTDGLSRRDTDALFHETERLAGLGHWEWDELEDRCTYCSAELARLHGITVQEFLGHVSSRKAELDLIHPEDRQRFLGLIDRLRENGEGFEIEYRLRQPDGDYLDVREKAEPVFDKRGSVIRSFGFVQDITARKKSEEALGRSEAFLKQAMRMARMGAWVWDDVSNECLYCSEELARLFGLTVEEFLTTRRGGSAVAEFIHPDDRARYRKTVAAAAKARTRYSVELRARSADGTYRHFLEVGESIDREDEPRRISAGFLQDITELKDTERALRQSEWALQRAQRQARIGSWLLDVSRKKLASYSDEYGRILGLDTKTGQLTKDAGTGRLLHPDDRESVVKAFKRFYEAGTGYEIEYRIVRPDGEVRHVFEIGEAVIDDHGQTVELTGTLQDITERKQAEEELKRYREELELLVEERTAQLRASERRLKEAQRIASLGSWELTASDDLSWSDEVFQIFDVTQEEFDTTTGVFYERVHPDDREHVRETTAKAWEARQTYDCVHRIVKRNGEIRTVRERAETVCDAHGVPVLSRGTVQDITEQTQVEERLQQALKMEAVGQLTGGVAHDFNNLLAVIMGNTELLQEMLRDQREGRLLEAIHRAGKRGAELTHRLLAFSRQQALMPKEIDMGTLASGMSDLLTRTLGETIEIEFLAPPGLWAASADPGQVENALLNLSINARDAMPSGGKLTIECRNTSLEEVYVAGNSDVLAGDYVLLSVTDSGSGMSEEIQAHVFEPFFTTKAVGQGSGLGLSMVYGFAKQSGGHVTIYSEEGKGTTVKLYLPRVAEASAAREVPVPEALPIGRGEMVLVVEDDPEVRSLAVRMLGNLGYRTTGAPEAATARGILADGVPVDLILSDVILPGGVSGPEFAEEVRASYPGMPVIFMSGYPADAAKRNGFLGSDRVLLSKPFSRRQLARALREALERKPAK